MTEEVVREMITKCKMATHEGSQVVNMMNVLGEYTKLKCAINHNSKEKKKKQIMSYHKQI